MESQFKYIAILFIFMTFSSFGLSFNTDEIIYLEGENLELADDEGYLLLSLESNKKISNLIIKSDRFGGNMKLKDVVAGENFALLKVKTGQYYWDSFYYYYAAGSIRFGYKKDKHFFRVEPGKINYPGTWSSTVTIPNRYRGYHSLNNINKSSYEMKKVREKHENIYLKYPFKFQGDVDDNYAQFLKDVVNQSLIETPNSSDMNDNKENDHFIYDSKDGIAQEINSYNKIENYIKDHNQSIGNFSPNGKYLFFKIMIEEHAVIRLLNLENYKLVNIFQKKLPKGSYISDIKWVDNDSIYYSVIFDGIYNERIAHLKINNNNEIVGADHIKLLVDGWLVDSLPSQNNKMYFGERFNSSKRKNGLYLIDVTSEKTIKKTSKKPVEIIKKLNNAVFYLTASDGKIRLFTTREYDEKDEMFTYEYWFLHQGESKWQKIYSTNSDSIEMPYRPVYITNDNKQIYVRTNKSSDKVSIHKHSSSDFSFDGVFYADDDIEITGLHIDEQTHEILGVYHVENGFHKIQYITDNGDELRHLRKQYPKHKFYVSQHNKEINKILVFGTNEYSKGSWSIYDTKSNNIEKLFETHPEYNKLEKGNFNTINIKTKDDLLIEGYLVTPKSNTKSQFPLVVIPHGGPIGVRDFAYNNDVQHFYASHGIATLKVNYRGSGGFGKKFKESGKKQWGKQIESDINQMVDHVVKNYNISKDEICSMGSSYGGYSAIMLTIIYPDRYKCAVSLAGVMDLPLMFTSSDFKSYEKSLEGFKKIVGDPQLEYQNLIDNSPLYLAEKISKPVLLFHGDEDERVTIEHSLRMKEILDLMNKDVQLITLKDEGHSFKNTESEIIYIARALDFLKKNLSIH